MIFSCIVQRFLMILPNLRENCGTVEKQNTERVVTTIRAAKRLKKLVDKRTEESTDSATSTGINLFNRSIDPGHRRLYRPSRIRTLATTRRRKRQTYMLFVKVLKERTIQIWYKAARIRTHCMGCIATTSIA